MAIMSRIHHFIYRHPRTLLRTSVGTPQYPRGQHLGCPQGIEDGTTAKGMPSSLGNTVSSSDSEANRTLFGRFGMRPTGFEARAVSVSDHPTSEVSAAFFKESISRLIIMGR